MPEMNKAKIVVGKEVFTEYLSEKKIQSRIKELADKISKDYKGKVPVFIGVLNGSFHFYVGSCEECQYRL